MVDQSPEQFSVLSSVYRGLVDILLEDGRSLSEITTVLDVESDFLEKTGEMLPVEKVTALWDMGFAARGNTIGIQAALLIKLADVQDLAIFLGSTQNVAELMEQLDQYSSLFATVGEFNVRPAASGLELSLVYGASVPLLHERLEFVALAGPVWASQYLSSPLKLSRVELTRPKPANTQPWDEAFGVSVRWGAPVTKYVIGYGEAARLILTRNTQMWRGFKILMNSRLNKKKTESPLANIRVEMVNQLPGNGPSVEAVAATLNISTRSLQRRLKKGNTSFSGLLSKIREELAKQYLSSGMPVKEVAYRLGYSETSVFNRAFKGWVGITAYEFLDPTVEKDSPL